MKINVEQLKTLVEAGDVSAIETHILNEALEKSDIYSALEKGDVVAAAEANKDVLSELDSLKDTHHQKALEKFKKNDVPKLIKDAEDAVRKELAPEETPEQKRIRELEEAFKAEKQKSAHAQIRSKLVELASSEGIELDAAFVNKHIDRFIPSTFEVDEHGEIVVQAVIDAVKVELTGFATDYKAGIAKEVETAMKGTARKDIGGVGGGEQTQRSFAQQLAQDIKAQQETKSQGTDIFYKSN